MNLQQSTIGILCSLAIAASACGSSSQALQGGGGPQGLDQGSDDPPHVFTPRSHPARVRPGPPPPDITALPKLVDRTSSCFDLREDEPSIAKPTTKKSKGKSKSKPSKSAKAGFVPYSPGGAGAGSGSGGATPASGSKPKPDPVKPAKPAEKKPVVAKNNAEGDADDASPTATTTPSTPPAEAPPTNAPAPDVGGEIMASGSADEESTAIARSHDSKRDAKKEARREKQKKKKSKDKALAQSSPEPTGEAENSEQLAIAQPDPDDQYHDWGASIYLSNDDSMSLSSAQRVIFAIDNFLPLPMEHIRPHEVLNYFSFETTPVAETDDFSVNAQIAPDPDQQGIYNLALAVRGRPMDKDTRRNTNLALVIDRSGSMADEGRMEYLKRGMKRMVGQLKTGDMLSVVLFDHDVCVPVENFVVGRDPERVLEKVFARMEPRGSTDVHAGLRKGYEILDQRHQPAYTNRALLVTDALANTGVTDPQLISLVGKYYDSRRIRLSGVGVGTEFNDDLLDKLTERGKGAYVFLGSPAEVDAVFGSRFVSLVETTALDTHFQLHLPPSLRMNVFYGEESSVTKEDVQAIHYFANTSQLFLSDLMAKNGRLRPQDSVMLTIEYEDPETGEEMLEEYAFNLGEVSVEGKNVKKSRLAMRFIDGLALLASRPTPPHFGMAPGSWVDETAFGMCEEGRGQLDQMTRGIEDDPEVRRIVGLWGKYCSRFERPRNPVRRQPAQQDPSWPSAVEQ